MIQAARNLGMEIIEQCLTPEQAVSASELFIVVTTKDIVPVVKFDGTPIGDGKPGPQTATLIAEFRKFTG